MVDPTLMTIYTVVIHGIRIRLKSFFENNKKFERIITCHKFTRLHNMYTKHKSVLRSQYLENEFTKEKSKSILGG